MYKSTVEFIQNTFGTEDFIPLHEPHFVGNEKLYLNDCIDSSYVSSIGSFVDRFEQELAKFINARYAIATVNGTSALHVALLLSGVERNDEVITQPLTFVATCNAIIYCGANPIFVDVDGDTLGMSPISLESFLDENTVLKDGKCFNKISGKIIKACVPMHTFGHPCRIDKIKSICENYKIALVEDAAESLGSYYKGRHTGTFGQMGAISFNGNKIITSGGGGCIITDDEELARKAKHITTTAKIPHKWAFSHDIIGYNYRMPNINAALLVAQLESLDAFLYNKRELAMLYKDYFTKNGIFFIEEPNESESNYWLNALVLEDKHQRDIFLKETNEKGVMTRPIWTLMNELVMFNNAQSGKLCNASWLADRVVNIPSSVRV